MMRDFTGSLNFLDLFSPFVHALAEYLSSATNIPTKHHPIGKYLVLDLYHHDSRGPNCSTSIKC